LTMMKQTFSGEIDRSGVSSTSSSAMGSSTGQNEQTPAEPRPDQRPA
jgi:hypothetical protein